MRLCKVQHHKRLAQTGSDGSIIALPLRLLRKMAGRFRNIESNVMTSRPVTCCLDDDVNDVMGKMSERHIAKVPVLSDAQLVGVISVGDVIKVMYDKLHTENQHLISYIHGGV